ncbi:flagellar hook-length control protein FliK [Cytobacillus sp. FJAT-53684]|uniref:Flagellar hook-length control protein FliK n=1 Tax=Cytobacillus mangrovibacter TaxID=3299024 RepID=A0ABW6JTJ7_9BACI
MDISSLGSINTLVSSELKSSASGKSANGFSSLFTNLMSGTSESIGSSPVTDEGNELTEEELAGLVQFLQMNDILELEDGLEILGKIAFQSEEDMINIIEEQLNLSSEELLQLLSSFYNKLTSIDGNAMEKETPIESENPQEVTPSEAILSLIHAISFQLQNQNAKVASDKDFGQAMKALKLFDLLSAHQDSYGNETRLKEFIKSMNEKLELKLNGQTSANRDEFLQRTFRNLVQEMKGTNSIPPAETSTENMAKLLNKTDSVNPGLIQFQQLSKPEQLTLMTNSQRPVSAEQLIEQFESILARSKFLTNGGTQKLFIKLNPEHLGALRVELIQKDSMLIARILTSTSVAKDMMESQLNGLKQAFSSQNIQIERVEISQQFTGQERTFNREQQQGQERQQQREEQKEQHSNDDFTHSFEEALLNTEA